MKEQYNVFLEDKNLIIVSNRGPIRYVKKDGALIGKENVEGLTAALQSLTQNMDCIWISCPISDSDRVVAKKNNNKLIKVNTPDTNYRIRFILPDKKSYNKYYGIIANPLLWFIHHYLWNPAYTPLIDERIGDAWYNGYVKVNQLFADEIVRSAKGRSKKPLVMFQDYHLYLAPRLVRAKLEAAFLYHFIHIPWPQPDYWKMLPTYLRRPIIEGILANDIVAFQTNQNTRNFLRTCEEILDLPVDYDKNIVIFKERKVHIKAYPISIDTEKLESLVDNTKVIKEERKIEKIRPEHLLLRVDRIDLSKNIVRGLIAYDIFLRDHPDFKNKILFLILLHKSRQDIKEYAEHLDRIFEISEQINERHHTKDWTPIEIVIKDSLYQVIAAYKQYDALLVNPIYDGMSLVSKEGPIINQRSGALILSENAGSHEQLGHYALIVNPFDVEWTANAIYKALTMTEEEKKWRQDRIRQIIRQNDIHKWISDQFNDIEKLYEY